MGLIWFDYLLVIAAGEKNPREIIVAKPEQMLTICYTSVSSVSSLFPLFTLTIFVTTLVLLLSFY